MRKTYIRTHAYAVFADTDIWYIARKQVSNSPVRNDLFNK